MGMILRKNMSNMKKLKWFIKRTQVFL
jgi:hypothetical protein